MWDIEEWDGSSWIAAVAFPSPGVDPFTEIYPTNVEERKLADGSEARLVPQNPATNEILGVTFLRKNSTTALLNRLKTYASDQTYLKITTHTGEQFKGYIKNPSRIWHLTGGTQKYTIKFSLRIFELVGT